MTIFMLSTPSGARASCQKWMGHVTIEMTERYAHLSPDTRSKAVGVLDRPAPACD
jgi:integrase